MYNLILSFIFCGLLVISSNVAQADGFRLGANTKINLTQHQKKSTDLFDTFKLTKNQLKKLRKVEPKTHEWIEVITSDYRDCACCLPQCVYVGESDLASVPHDYLGLRIYLDNRPKVFQSVSGSIHTFTFDRNGKFMEEKGVGISKKHWRRGDLVIYDCPKYFNSVKIRTKVEKLITESKQWAKEKGVKVGRFINGKLEQQPD